MKLELIKEEKLTFDGIETLYYIRKNGDLVTGSLAYDFDRVKKLYDIILEKDQPSQITVILTNDPKL